MPKFSTNISWIYSFKGKGLFYYFYDRVNKIELGVIFN